jgi:hypothetical protein
MAGENILEKAGAEKIVAPVNQTEKTKNPEKQTEQVLSTPRQAAERLKPSAVTGAPTAPKSASASTDFQQQRSAAIDDILSAGLNEVFLKMDAKKQQEFKKQGEITVIKINLLLNRTQVKINKIIDLIRAWLKLIPGVSRFFLEQETKIKADKIIKIKDKF